MSMKPIHVIGGGLAGSEAAWQIAEAGVPVTLHEMRPQRGTDAHQTDHLAELVCSNSFRADDWTGNAVGLLHAEMRALGSIIMACGDAHQVPAGGDDQVPAWRAPALRRINRRRNPQHSGKSPGRPNHWQGNGPAERPAFFFG